MRTILVIYTNSLITDLKNISKSKKYSFNTSSDVMVGDLIKSPNYETSMQVVKILDKSYTYFNSSTGELSDTFNSTSQWENRTLEIVNNNEETVIAYKIN